MGQGGPVGGNVSLGAASGSITINTRGVAQAQAVVSRSAASMTTSLNKVGSGAAQAGGGLTSLGGATTRLTGALAGGLSVGLAVALGALVKYGAEASKIAGQNERTRQSFDSLAEGVNASSEGMLAAMRKASSGLVSDSELILGANQGIISGVADSAEELSQLLAVAQARAAATGRTSQEAFQRLITGIGRKEVEVLDELGLRFNLNEVYDSYAESIGTVATKLTEAQKSAAIFNRVIADSRDLVEASANRTQTAGEQYERFATSSANATSAIGDLINALGTADAAGGFATGMDSATEAIKRLTEAIRLNRAEGAVGVGVGAGTVQTPGNLASFQNDRRLLEEGRARVLNDISTGARPASVTGPLLAELDGKLRAVNNTIVQFNARLALATNNVPGAPPWMAGVNMAQGAASASTGRTTEQDTAILQNSADVQAIESQAQQQRIAATQQYEQQRSETISGYQTNLVREAQDFAMQRQRQEARLADQIADIHEAAAARELDIAQEAAQRETAAAAALADSIARAREDAARQEERAVRDLERNIGKMREGSAEREAEWSEDLNESIAEARANSNEKLVKLEQDFQKSREHAAQDSRDTILNAASRLDANAVFEEQKRYERESKQANEAHQEAISEEHARLQEYVDAANESHAERLADERANLAESVAEAREAHNQQRADAREALDLRIADEQESYAKRLEEAKAADVERLAEAKTADAQRILDMKKAWEDEKTEEDIDRGIRLTRLETDHQKQLGSMATAHSARMTQIGTQEAELKRERQAAFLAELADVGLYHTEWIKQQKKLQEDALKLFDAWWEAVNKRFVAGTAPSLANPYGGMQTPVNQPMTIPGGIGPAPFVNPYAPSGGAMPINPYTMTPQGGAQASSLSVGGINIYESKDARATGEEVERALIRIAQKVGRPQ